MVPVVELRVIEGRATGLSQGDDCRVHFWLILWMVNQEVADEDEGLIGACNE